MGVGLALLGGALALGLHYGLQQTDLSNGTVAAIQMGAGAAGGLGLSLLSPEAGGGLAVLSVSLGGMRLMGSSVTKSGSVVRSRPAKMRIKAGALAGLDADDLDSLGAVTAMLGDGYDDDDMGAVTAQLGDGAGYGGGYDDDDMGAVTAQLGDVEPDEDEDGGGAMMGDDDSYPWEVESGAMGDDDDDNVEG